MTIPISKKFLIAGIGAPFIILLISLFLALSPLIEMNADLAMGITYDLTIVSPVLYFLLIRKSKLPNISAVPVFVLGVVLATLILPTQFQLHLSNIKVFVLPIVELIVISTILWKVSKTIKTFRSLSNTGRDFYLLFKQSASQVLGQPLVAAVLATEVAMIYYALFAWKKRIISPNEYSAFRENAVIATLATFIFLIVAETFALHFILIKWNITVAWVLFGVSLYTGIQLFGHLRAIRKRYTKLEERVLHLKYGLFGDVSFSVDQIEEIKITSKSINDETLKVQQLAILSAMESHNIAIYLKQPAIIQKAYGIAKSCDVVLFHIDKKEEFVKKVLLSMNNTAG